MPDWITQPKPARGQAAFDWLNAPTWEGPTRASSSLADIIDNPEGEGGRLQGFLAGATQGAGNVLSDMTSPLSIGMTALGMGGAKRLGALSRLSKNAARIGPEAEAFANLPAEFTPVGKEAITNAARKTAIEPSQGALSKMLPQVEDAYASGGGTSVYKPEVSKEMGRLMVEMLDEGPIKDAFKIAQDQYPRLMGHVNDITVGASPESSLFSRFMTAGGSKAAPQGLPGSTSMSSLRVDPASFMNYSPEGMANTIGHELTHVGQRLRKGYSGFRQAYDAPMEGAKGLSKELAYWTNPMEKSARQSGLNFSRFATRE